MSINLSTNLLTYTEDIPRINLGGNNMEKLPELVPISMFNKGHASKILKDVKENNNIKLVVKNNEVEAVIISLDMYNQILLKELLNTGNLTPKDKDIDEIGGSLHKYAKKEYVGKEKELYKEAIDEKYRKRLGKE